MDEMRTEGPSDENAGEAPLRVLLVTHRFPPDAVAGVERYTENLAGHLATRADVVAVLTRRPSSGPVDPRPILEKSAFGHVYRITGGSVRRGGDFLHDGLRLDAAFSEVVDDFRPDIVHVNHLIDLSPNLVTISQKNGAAVVFSLHDYYMSCPRINLQLPDGEICSGPDGGRACASSCFDKREELIWKVRAAYFRRLLTLPEKLVCPSSFVATQFAALGADASRLTVLPNGLVIDPVGHTAISPPPPSTHGLHVAFLGAVLPHKGPHLIIEALRQAELRAARLSIFGPVDEPMYVQRIIDAASGVRNLDLRIYGEYDLSQLPLLLDSVHCLVAPSVWPETFGLVVREALALGVPVIAARVGALPEPIDEARNGFTFDPSEPDELVGLLKKMEDDQSLLERLRQGARATTALSGREHACSMRSLYEEALIERRARASASSMDESEAEVLYEVLQNLAAGRVA